MRKCILILFCLLLAANSAWCAAPPDFRQDWLKLFKSGDPRERSVAIEHLGFPDCRTKEGVAYLHLLGTEGLQDSSPLVRETVLDRLRFTLSPSHHGGCHADEELTTALLRTLKDQSPGVREGGLRILGMTQAGWAIAEIAVLLKDSEFTVRQQAVVALGRIGDSQTLPLLLALFPERQEWRDALVQQEALYSIRKIVAGNHKIYIHRFRNGDRREEKFNVDADLLDKIRITMIRAADDPWLRREAFEFFATIATEGARDLLQSATKDTDPTIRKLAYDGISRLNTTIPTESRCGYEAIAAALRDPQPGIRAAALAKLPACSTEIDRTLLVAHLVDGIYDANQEVSAAALANVASIGGIEVLQALVGKFGAESYETRKIVREVFLEIVHGDHSVAATAATRSFAKMKMGHHRNKRNEVIIQTWEGVPPAAANASVVVDSKNKRIIVVGSPPESSKKVEQTPQAGSIEAKAVDIILTRFPSLSLKGKTTALEVLDKLNDVKIKQFAISLLDDPQPGIKIHAVILLRKFDVESLAQQLFKSAQDKDHELRYTAISSLIEAEKLPEGCSLARIAENPDPAVRNSLVQSIQQYVVRHDNKLSPAIRNLIVKMLNDPDFNIRQLVTFYFRENLDKSSIDRLAIILARDGNCSNAAFALARLGDSRGMDALYEAGKGVCDTPKVYFHPGKRESASALSKAKDPRATRLLCDILERGNDDDYQVVIQLGATKDKHAAPCLASYGKKQKLGREVMYAIRSTASPDVLDFLKESLDTYQYNPTVLKETILAISVTPGTEALEVLLGEIRNSSKYANEMRSALADRAMRDSDALSYLFMMVGREPQILSSVSVEIGFRAAHVPLWQKQVITLAEHGDKNVRKGTIIALGLFHDNQSLELLKKLAAGSDRDLAFLAGQSLETRNKRKKL